MTPSPHPPPPPQLRTMDVYLSNLLEVMNGFDTDIETRPFTQNDLPRRLNLGQSQRGRRMREYEYEQRELERERELRTSRQVDERRSRLDAREDRQRALDRIENIRRRNEQRTLIRRRNTQRGLDESNMFYEFRAGADQELG